MYKYIIKYYDKIIQDSLGVDEKRSCCVVFCKKF